jgi:putative ABC transport system substrate-binding protein
LWKHVIARVSYFAPCALLFALCLPVEAQQIGKVYRIGYLIGGFRAGTAPLLDAFRQGMHELGHIEGKHFVIEPRWGEGRGEERLPSLALELVQLKVDVIVAAPTPPAVAAHRATRTIPIVVAHMSDPVEAGLVANLARPGGNVTGLRSLQAELAGKRLELLKDAFPKISRVAVLGAPRTNLGARRQMRELEGTAHALGLELRRLDWNPAEPDFHALSRDMVELQANAFTMISGLAELDHLAQILELPAKIRVPAIYPSVAYVDGGGLMSYGINYVHFHRRAAYYVDKILKGAKPGDLPVEQETKFELVINLKTARALDLPIPAYMLRDADRVIK